MWIESSNVNTLWLQLLRALLTQGRTSSPRGQATLEIIPLVLHLEDSLNNIITIPERKLNYSFMVAEWFWIAAARDDVQTISHYNKEIARFSDDGVSYFGAYGPRIRDQRSYVIRKLKEDPNTRQAIITTWRPNPPGTRDVPCTVSFQYLIRNNKLISNVTMRSSDAWLGVPYDIFNFSRLQAHLAADLDIEPGALTLFLGSSHVYEQHFGAANRIIDAYARNKQLYSALLSSSSPLLTKMLPQMMDYIEIKTRIEGDAGAYGSPWSDYAEALAYRTHRDISQGSGHMIKIARHVKYVNELMMLSDKGDTDEPA